MTRSKASTQAKLPTKGGVDDDSIGANESNKGKIVDEQNLSKNDESKLYEKEESKDDREESEEIEWEAMGNQICIQKAKRQAVWKQLMTKLNRKLTVPENPVTSCRCQVTNRAKQRRSMQVSCISNFHALISILTNVLSLQTR